MVEIKIKGSNNISNINTLQEQINALKMVLNDKKLVTNEELNAKLKKNGRID